MPAFDGNAIVGGTRYFVPISADVYLTIANNEALPYLPAGADMDSLTYKQYADWAVAVAEGEGEGKGRRCQGDHPHEDLMFLQIHLSGMITRVS